MNTSFRRFRASIAFLVGVSVLIATSGLSSRAAEQRVFQRGGTNVILQDVSQTTEVFFQSMRLNRALNQWNFELQLRNTATTALIGPAVVVFESVTNSSGLVAPDGLDSTGKPWVDMSAQLPAGGLATAAFSALRTVALGTGTGTPQTSVRVFAPVAPMGLALALANVIDPFNHPITGAQIEEWGPDGSGLVATDSTSGAATVGRGAGTNTFRFSAPGYLPVWRRAVLAEGSVFVLPTSRLVPREANSTEFSSNAGSISNLSGSVRVTVPAGAFDGTGSAVLTSLTPQTLPALLPLGWSPVQAFWLELSREPGMPLPARLTLSDSVRADEIAVVTRWNSTNLQWEVAQLLPGLGAAVMDVSLPGSGAFALVVPDRGGTGPVPGTVGQALAGSPPLPYDRAALTGDGRLSPASSSASRVAELVTSGTVLVVSNSAAAMPSGTLFRGIINERYDLQDGSTWVLPGHDIYISGYQRPGDGDPKTLEAAFPLRPQILLGADELLLGSVQLDVQPPTDFVGGVVGTNGASFTNGPIQIAFPSGAVSRAQAIQIDPLEITLFTNTVTGGLNVVAAFELSASGLGNQPLALQVQGLVTNALFVLARVRSEGTVYGLEPVERLMTDGRGRLISMETGSTPRLPGLRMAGQFVLVQVSSLQSVIAGTAKNMAGESVAGLVIHVEPWVTFSGPGGAFQILASAGQAQLRVRDAQTSDIGFAGVTVLPGQPATGITASVANDGPRVMEVSPTDGATNVSLVTAVAVRFSKSINPMAVARGDLQLLAGTNLVNATVSLNLANTVATFLSSEPLKGNTTYTVVVSTNVADASGRLLTGPGRFTFRTVYEPFERGASQLTSYEPRNGLAGLVGGPGMAEPDAPVILVNETTGWTSTIRSNPDGSFSNSVVAEVDDRLSAVLVNQNGTRNQVRVSRQRFADGSEALFEQGGTIEVVGENGPIQFIVEPGSIPGKTKFKFEPVPLNVATQMVGGVQPVDGGRILGGVKMAPIRGAQLTHPIDVRFPVKVSDMGLPEGVSPTNCGFGLAIARFVDGERVYELIDRMHYEDGHLVTHSPPFFGLLGPYEDLFLLPFLMVVSQTPVVVTGQVYAEEVGATARNYLTGAFVTSKGNANTSIAGRLRAGSVYTVTGELGKYTLLVSGTAAQGGFMASLSATHPLFPQERAQYETPLLNNSQLLTIGNVITRADLVFPVPPDGFSFPPGLSASHTPSLPATNTGCVLRVTATDNNAAPTINVEVDTVRALLPGDYATPQDVVITMESDVPTATSRQKTLRITTYRALVCSLKLTALDNQGNSVEQIYPIPFGAEPPPPVVNPPTADVNDRTGPLVINSSPPSGSTGLSPGQAIILRMSEPVRREFLTMPGVFVLSPPAGTPDVQLSEDQLEIRLVYPSIKPETSYSFVVGSTIEDLNRNFLDQDPVMTGNQPFSATFRSAPERVFSFPVQPADRGVVSSFLQGNYAYVLDRSAASASATTAAAQPLGTELGRLAVYDMSNPAAPVLAGQYLMPPFPRDLIRLPNYSFIFLATNDASGRPMKAYQTYTPLTTSTGPVPLPRVPRVGDITNAFTNDLVAIVGGLAGSDNQWLRIVDTSDPEQPRRLAGTITAVGSTFIPGRLRWSPPVLAYMETGDRDRISLVNVQSLLFMELLSQDRSAYLELPRDGFDGLDSNGDGDYTDEGEKPPLPPSHPFEFGGKIGTVMVPDTTQPIRDFVLENGGGFIGAIVGPGVRIEPSGQPVSPTERVPAGYRTLYFNGLNLTYDNSQFDINGSPRRLLALMGQTLEQPNGKAERDLVCITVNGPESEDYLLVLDVTEPLNVTRVLSLPLPASPEGENVHSIVRREDGLLAVAGEGATFLINPEYFQKPVRSDGSHPALVATIPGIGGFPRNFDSTLHGYHLSSDEASRGRLVQTPPEFAFVRFPTNTPLGMRMLTNLLWYAPTNLTRISPTVVAPTVPSGLRPFVAPMENVAVADLTRKVLTNLSAVERAQSLAGLEQPGFLQPTFLRQYGPCYTNSPRLVWNDYYVLVRAPGGAGPKIELALESLDWAGQPMRKRGLLFPPVHALSEGALNTIGQTPDADDAPVRTLTAWRLSDDPGSDDFNRYLSRPFWLVTEAVQVSELTNLKARLDREILWSGQSLRATIDPIMANNAVLGPYVAQADIFEHVIKAGAQATAESFPGDLIPSPNPGPVNGELLLPTLLYAVSAHSGELVMKSTDLALPGRRLPIAFQRTFRGQAIHDGPFGRGWDFNFNQRVIEVSTCLSITPRSNPEDAESATDGDLLFHPGGAPPIVYRLAGTNAPPEIASDPLIQNLGWLPRAARYYLPPAGMFSPMIKFKDGRYVRLDPDGKQTWFNAAGRLDRVYDRYEKNFQELVYNQRGQLIRIWDDVRRPLDLGYFRPANDPLFRAGIDMAPRHPTDVGRVCRLRDYSGRDVLYTYTSDGLLERYQGVEITSGPVNTFRGRQEIVYRYTGSTNLNETAKSLNSVEGGDVGGVPLLSVTSRSPQGRDVVGSVSVMGAATTLSQSFQNSATALERGGAEVSVNSPGSASSKLLLDPVGRPTESVMSGDSGPTITNKQEYYGAGPGRGMVRATVSPSGDRTEYTYDTNNATLRSRGNLKSIKKIPGPRGGPVLEAKVDYDGWYNLPVGDKVDFNGVPATIVLTPDRRNTERVTRAGEREEFLYNSYGQLEKHTSMDGIVTLIDYTADGFVHTRKLGDLPPTVFSYIALSGAQDDPGLRGKPSGVTDPSGVTTYFWHDELDRIVAEERAGAYTSQAFDRVGNLTERVTQVETNRVLVQQFDYLSHGFLREKRVLNVETVDGLTNLVTRFEPDAMNRVRRMITPSGEEHLYYYNHLGQLAVEEIPGRQTNILTHDVSGNLVQIQKGDAVDKFIFDGHDRLIGIVGANGTSSEYVLDGNGNTLTNIITDKEGVVLHHSWAAYDVLNRVRSKGQMRDDGPVSSRYDYFSADRKVVVTDALNQKVESFSDTAGRITRVVSPHKTLELVHDDASNLRTQRLTEGGRTYEMGFEYNSRRQVTKISNNLGFSQDLTVDVDGRVLRDSNRERHITTNVFTILGELAASIRPTGVAQTNQFDLARNITSVADNAGNTSRYLFNAQNFAVTNYLPNGQFETYEDFNVFGLPRRQRLPRGVTVTSAFDFEGKLTNRTVTGIGPTLRDFYEYDGLRRYSQIRDSSGVMHFRYDLGGFIREVSRTNTFNAEPVAVPPLPNTFSQQADPAGFRTLLVYPSAGLNVSFKRDPSGRLTSVTPTGGEPVVTNIVWEGDSRHASYVLGNNRILLEKVYDGEPRLLGNRYTRLSDGVVLADVRYAFDRNGAVLARQHAHRGGLTDFFRYDSGYRLKRADMAARPGATSLTNNFGFVPGGLAGDWRPGVYAREASYSGVDLLTNLVTRNPLGNFAVPMPASFGAVDAFVCARDMDGFVRQVDAVGNVTRTLLAVRIPGAVAPELVAANLIYNAMGQLERIDRDDGVKLYFEYDAFGLRLRKAVTGPVARCTPTDVAFLYNDGLLLEERDLSAGAALLRRYYYTDTGDEPVAADIRASAGSPLTRVFLLTDNLRSVISVTDATGTELERRIYDPWGQPVYELPDVAAPQLNVVRQETDGLVIVFSEPVLPALTTIPAATNGPITSFPALSAGIRITDGTSPIAGVLEFEDREATAGQGATIRFKPTQPISGTVRLEVDAGFLRDEWNNRNPAVGISFTAGQPAGTVLHNSAVSSTRAALAGTSSVPVGFGFHGQYFDEETGLLYCRARYYDCYAGTFTQRDPKGYADSVNQYAGFANNPVNFRDPSGSSVASDMRRMGETLQEDAEKHRNEHSMLGHLKAKYEEGLGALLSMPSSMAESWEVLNSPSQGGSLDLLRRIEAAETLSRAPDQVRGIISKASNHYRNLRTISGFLARRVEGIHQGIQRRVRDAQARKETHEFLMKQGLTSWEAEGLINIQAYIKAKYGADNVEIAVRGFGKKADMRRANREKGMATKPGWVADKTGDDAITRLQIEHGGKQVSRQMCGDIDMYYIKVDGRTLGENEVGALKIPINQAIGAAYKRQGGTGMIGASVHHGAHVNVLEQYGSLVNNYSGSMSKFYGPNEKGDETHRWYKEMNPNKASKWNDEKLASVNGPRPDAFSVRTDGAGRVEGFEPATSLLSQELDDANHRFWLQTGRTVDSIRDMDWKRGFPR